MSGLKLFIWTSPGELSVFAVAKDIITARKIIRRQSGVSVAVGELLKEDAMMIENIPDFITRNYGMSKPPKTPSQRGKAARLRGQRHEQRIVNLFKRVYPESFRHLESQKHEAEKKVDMTAGPFIVQCKHEQEYVPAHVLFETPEQEGKIVLLVSGGHGVKLPDLVILRWLDLDKFASLPTPRHTIANPGSYPSLNRALAELKKLENWDNFLPALGLANGKEDVVLCAMLLTDFLELCRNMWR